MTSYLRHTSVSTRDKAINSSDASALCHYYLLIQLWGSLLSSTSKVYINPRIVALTIQLVLLPSSPCAQCELSSGPCIKDIRSGTLHCDSQVCVTCLRTRRVVLQLQARLSLLYLGFSSCSSETYRYNGYYLYNMLRATSAHVIVPLA